MVVYFWLVLLVIGSMFMWSIAALDFHSNFRVRISQTWQTYCRVTLGIAQNVKIKAPRWASSIPPPQKKTSDWSDVDRYPVLLITALCRPCPSSPRVTFHVPRLQGCASAAPKRRKPRPWPDLIRHLRRSTVEHLETSSAVSRKAITRSSAPFILYRYVKAGVAGPPLGRPRA